MIFNLSHYDLDGAVSSILMDHVSRIKGHDIRHFYTTYGTRMADDIKEMCSGFPRVSSTDGKGKVVVVTDLHIDPVNMRELQKLNCPIFVLDHHPESVSVQYSGDGIRVVADTEKCGATIVWDFFKMETLLQGSELLEPLRLLAHLAEDYDTWKLKDKRSYVMNLLFFNLKKRFWDAFGNGFSGVFSDEHVTLAKKVIDRKRDIIANADRCEYCNMDGKNVTLVLASQNITEVSSDVTLFVPGYELYICYNPARGVMSVRYAGKNPDMDLKPAMEKAVGKYLRDTAVPMKNSSMYQIVESFGGHPRAGGISLNEFGRLPENSITIGDITFRLHCCVNGCEKVLEP